MNIVISIILTLLVFTIIVTIHEGGHFLAARKMGVFVEEFSIGMGPALYQKKTKKETIFSLRLLPIGGYCKMKGEEQEEGVVPEENAFTGKAPWRRALIVAAGPVANFVLALILSFVLNITAGYIEPVLESVEEGYPAAEAGFEAGDRLIELNGERIHCYSKVSFLLMYYEEGDVLNVVVKTPSGERKEASFALKYDEEYQKYRIGFSAHYADTFGQQVADNGFLPTLGKMIAQSFWDVLFQIELTVRSVGMMFTGKVGLDGLTGPIGIVSVVNDTYTAAASYGFSSVLISMADLMLLISANLGVLNLFPIPGLDGSRLVFLLVERIRRKPMNAKVENIIYLIGFILLFGLMIVVAVNDVIKLII